MPAFARPRWLAPALLLGGALALGWAALWAVAWLRVALDDSAPSRSVGTPARGRLLAGRVMPPSGPGYATYSLLGSALGRQYVHQGVRDTLVAAFSRAAAPGRRFVLGETGLAGGGPIRMHRTHQSGLSVDIFMPMQDERGAPAALPSWPHRTFGYGYELDDKGRLGALRIDFSALGSLLAEIGREAPRHGLRVRTIIIAPEYVPLLLAAPGVRLGPLADALTRRPVWVRHDEHVHLDFSL